ncbi:MAG: MoaD/ThiS family protein [Dehalococcoidia bacterium]|nr:MoaD/ThiS family protein [Dehalococcoidia bacterium]MDP7470375.1 MoaD/ThiS family protein [Dehalococcoidia bacterium]
MAVTVRFFGRLHQLLGRDEVVVQGSPGTIGELIWLMARQHSRVIKEELLDEDGNIDYSYALFIGGERVEGPHTPIRAGQEVTVTSMLAGGQRCSTTR